MKTSINLNCTKENVSKKIDSTGRLTIPKNLRERYDFRDEDELYFYSLNNDTCDFLAISKNKDITISKYALVASILEELELEVPEKIKELL